MTLTPLPLFKVYCIVEKEFKLEQYYVHEIKHALDLELIKLVFHSYL